jgi:hypothetical protein
VKRYGPTPRASSTDGQSSKRRQLIDRLIRNDRYLRLAPRVVAGSMQAFSCQRGGFLVLEDITACAIKRDSKLIWSEPLAGVFRAGAAATRHIPPSAKIDVVVFPANFRRYSQAKSGFVVSTREFVSSVSGDRNEIERRSPACKLLGS